MIFLNVSFKNFTLLMSILDFLCSNGIFMNIVFKGHFITRCWTTILHLTIKGDEHVQHVLNDVQHQYYLVVIASIIMHTFIYPRYLMYMFLEKTKFTMTSVKCPEYFIFASCFHWHLSLSAVSNRFIYFPDCATIKARILQCFECSLPL